MIDRTGGTSNVNVTLSWNVNTSCGVEDLADLRVARWGDLSSDAAMMWRDHGNGGTTGNTTAGTIITSAAVTRFSPFTLASNLGLNPLPIQLLSFNAKCDGSQVDLTWITASEKDNHYFTVEKSTDGFSFSPIGRIEGAGNSSSLISYQFEDKNPSLETTYYRLKQNDFDGNFEYFDIISSNCEFESNDISLYPNPSKGNLTIRGINENTQVIVSDMTGKQVYSQSTNSNLLYVDLSRFSSGVYQIALISESKTIIKKVVLEK
jgi:hypothetical protein